VAALCPPQQPCANTLDIALAVCGEPAYRQAITTKGTP
jgi:hypothetical protein